MQYMAIIQMLKMGALIKKAADMGLTNFKDLKQYSGNQNIKESAEAILYLLQGKKVSLYKDRAFECGPGTLTNLQNILLDISGGQSLKVVVSRYKKELLEHYAQEMLKGAKINDEQVIQEFGGNFTGSNRGGSMNVHDVSSILNVLSDEWKILKKSLNEDK